MDRMGNIAGNGYTMLEMTPKAGNDCKMLEWLLLAKNACKLLYIAIIGFSLLYLAAKG